MLADARQHACLKLSPYSSIMLINSGLGQVIDDAGSNDSKG